MFFDDFECDNCGACCSSLIVECTELDAQREPKLYSIHPVDREKFRYGDNCINPMNPKTMACHFLGEGNLCSIYPTRPTCCVAVEAGDAKCQQARLMKSLPLLRDKHGNLPDRDTMEESCDHYGLDLEEILGE